MRGYELESAIVDFLLEINSEDIRKEGEENLREIALDDLREGMRVAKDIRRDSGALVLPSETALTKHTIEILIKFNELNCVKNKAYIYK